MYLNMLKEPTREDGSWIAIIAPADVEKLVFTPSDVVGDIVRKMDGRYPDHAVTIADRQVHPDIVLAIRYNVPVNAAPSNGIMVASADGSSSFVLQATYPLQSTCDVREYVASHQAVLHSHAFVHLLPKLATAHCHFEFIPKDGDPSSGLIDNLVACAIQNPQSLVAALDDPDLIRRHSVTIDDKEIDPNSVTFRVRPPTSLSFTVSLIPLENRKGRALENVSCPDAAIGSADPICIPGSVCGQLYGALSGDSGGWNVDVNEMTAVVWRNLEYQ